MPRFPGYHNHRNYFLQKYDEALIDFAVPKTPEAVTSRHLTLLTLLAALFNLGVGILAAANFRLLWLLLPVLLLHHIVDTLDGALGRARREGWILWGYFMDKFVDFIYVGSLSAAFLLAQPQDALPALFIFLGYGGLMVQAYLMFGATGKLPRNRGRLGPTEAKALLGILIVIAVLGGREVFRHPTQNRGRGTEHLFSGNNLCRPTAADDVRPKKPVG